MCRHNRYIALFEGVVDKHIKEIERRVFDTVDVGEKFMDEYLKEVSTCVKKFLIIRTCIY